MITWWSMSLLASIFLAIYIYSNQILRLPSNILMLYRGFGVFLAMLPLCIVYYDKFGILFYIFCTIQGLGISYIDNKYFRSSKVFGADITSFMQPLSLFLTFSLWLMIKPHLFWQYVDNPLKSSLIILSLFGVVVSVLLMKKVKINQKAFLYLLPCVFVGAYLDNNNKLALDNSGAGLIPTLIYYNMISGLFAGIGTVYNFRHNLKKMKKAFSKKVVLKGLFIVLSLSMLVFTKAYALILAINPSYVVAINYLAPLWIVFFNYVYNLFASKPVAIKVNFKLMLLMVASVIVLILSSR